MRGYCDNVAFGFVEKFDRDADAFSNHIPGTK